MSKKFIAMIVGGLGIVVAGVLIMSTSAENTSANELDSDNNYLRPVPTVVAVSSKATVTRNFPGRVQAARRVELAFDVAGVLVELNAQEGSVVAQGDVIAKIDSRELQNNYTASKVVYEDAQRIYKRAEVLREKNIISKSEYDKAKADWQIAQAKMDVCRKNLDDSVLVAPFSGVIAARKVENYQRISEHQVIISLQDISREEVVIQLPEHFIAHDGFKALRNIQVQFDVDDSRWFKAELSEYRMQPDSYTRTYDAVISIYPPQDLTILPGMTATVVMEWDSLATAGATIEQIRHQIPVEAVWSDGHNKSFVWVIPEAGGHPQKSEVVVEKLLGGTAVIVGGINDGEHIAISGVHALTELLQVRPMLAGRKGLNG